MAENKREDRGGCEVVVPVDASGIEDRSGLRELRALYIDSSGATQAKTLKIGEDGRTEARFGLKRRVAGRVVVGPADATDEELQGLQTLAADVPLRAFGDEDIVQLSPLVVHPWYWHWWLRWCRTFTIRGRLTCPDGSPVPGATVCAFDVDRLWWWCSRQQVDCAVTDASGAFSITFRWCCGWWPWWWWRRRLWQIDPGILERIKDGLQRAPDLPIPPLPDPDPVPDLGIFRKLIAGDAPETGPSMAVRDPAQLEALRPQLAARLPHLAEMETLRIWPWAPWHPWADCHPDIIFRATQDCGQGEVVILEEDCGDARWNIPTVLDVSLVASNAACCARPRNPRCPDENCIVLSHICDDLVSTIGGNTGAPAGPAGYRHPGAVATWGDRPYAGTIPIRGVCADWIDYYGFEYSSDNGATWNPLPPNATGGVTQTYFDPGGPPWFVPVPFSFQTVDGQWVIETLAHWESVNGLRTWVGDITRLINWRTTIPSAPTGPTALFADGTYHLRLRGWREIGGNLTDLGIPPLCGTQSDNQVAVRLDNRLVGPGAGHPTTPTHPVGGVHLATTEPDTDFIEVRVNGVPVAPCSIVEPEGVLEIDFFAHDPDGHLAYYTLAALWGENNSRNLLSTTAVPSGSLTRLAAAQVGPSYGAARAGAGAENLPAAPAPTWNGGRMRLTVTNIRDAFPVPCAYLLDLRAYKRTILDCDEGFDNHWNRSTLTFTVL